MTRRDFGSVRKLPSGKWQATYWHEGRRHVAEGTFKAKADATAWLSTVQTSILHGQWVDPAGGKMTFCELAAQWLASNPAKRPNSLATDEIAVRVHLAPFESRRIQSITQPHIQGMVNAWTLTQSPRTVRRNYGVLASVFSYAVKADLLGRSPCRDINLPALTATLAPRWQSMTSWLSLRPPKPGTVRWFGWAPS
jgi:hypothetical protein